MVVIVLLRASFGHKTQIRAGHSWAGCQELTGLRGGADLTDAPDSGGLEAGERVPRGDAKSLLAHRAGDPRGDGEQWLRGQRMAQTTPPPGPGAARGGWLCWCVWTWGSGDAGSHRGCAPVAAPWGRKARRPGEYPRQEALRSGGAVVAPSWHDQRRLAGPRFRNGVQEWGLPAQCGAWSEE